MTERDVLLEAGATPHATTLEDYVTRHDGSADTLGARHAAKRDAVTINWLREAVAKATRPVSVLDVGCSYGNHLFMLNSALGKCQGVALIGVDLDEAAIRRANAFAARISGFANCSFVSADVTRLPFPDATFAALNLADVLEHIPTPAVALREIARVTRPGGTVVVSTPLRDSIFKRAAVAANRLSRGGLYRGYYAGKGDALDADGLPIMETTAGEAHVSEMTLVELKSLCASIPLEIEQIEPMAVMSGSRWFDEHVVLLSAVLLLEGVHERLRRPSWAHSVMLKLRRGE